MTTDTTAAAPAQTALSKVDPTGMLARILGTREDPEAITNALVAASEYFHLVTPATTCGKLVAGCSVAMSMVLIDPADEAFPTKTARKNIDGKWQSVALEYGLGKAGMDRIESALGVAWDPEFCRRTDDGSVRNYWVMQAIGYVRGFDLSQRTIKGTKELDLRDGSAQVLGMIDQCIMKAERGLRYKAQLKRGDPTPPALTEQADAEGREGARLQIRQKRLHGLRLCETGARLAAVATLVRRGPWTPDQLRKPFIIARLIFTGEGMDPEVAGRMAFDAMTNATQRLYSGPQHGRLTMADRESPQVIELGEAPSRAPPAAPRQQAAPPPRAPSPPPTTQPPPEQSRPAQEPQQAPPSVCANRGVVFGDVTAETCAQVLKADQWCDWCKAGSSAAAPSAGGPVLPFGRAKGKTVGEASTDDLAWIAPVLAGNVNDADKSKWREQNEALLRAVTAELERRPDPEPDPSGIDYDEIPL